jgi:hypothetical protein
MIDAELQLIECDWMLIGYRTNRAEQLQLLALCRRFDGRVVFREGKVMLLEFGAYRDVLDDALLLLPRAGVTHFWRSGTAKNSGEANAPGGIQFLRQAVWPQNVHSCECVSVVSPPPGVLLGGGPFPV